MKRLLIYKPFLQVKQMKSGYKGRMLAAALIGAALMSWSRPSSEAEIRYYGKYRIPRVLASTDFSVRFDSKRSKYGDSMWVECYHDLDGDGKTDAKTYHKVLEKNLPNSRTVKFDYKKGDTVMHIIATWPFAYEWDRNGNGVNDFGDEAIVDPDCYLNGNEMPESDWFAYAKRKNSGKKPGSEEKGTKPPVNFYDKRKQMRDI